MTPEEGQRLAREIARRFGNLHCDDCAREIVKKLGKGFRATLERLRTADRSDVMVLSSNEMIISLAGGHVGVGIAGFVIDNHHPEGVPEAEWQQLFKSVTGAALLRASQPTSRFFGRIFLAKNFNRWISEK